MSQAVVAEEEGVEGMTGVRRLEHEHHAALVGEAQLLHRGGQAEFSPHGGASAHDHEAGQGARLGAGEPRAARSLVTGRQAPRPFIAGGEAGRDEFTDQLVLPARERHDLTRRHRCAQTGGRRGVSCDVIALGAARQGIERRQRSQGWLGTGPEIGQPRSALPGGVAPLGVGVPGDPRVAAQGRGHDLGGPGLVESAHVGEHVQGVDLPLQAVAIDVGLGCRGIGQGELTVLQELEACEAGGHVVVWQAAVAVLGDVDQPLGVGAEVGCEVEVGLCPRPGAVDVQVVEGDRLFSARRDVVGAALPRTRVVEDQQLGHEQGGIAQQPAGLGVQLAGHLVEYPDDHHRRMCGDCVGKCLQGKVHGGQGVLVAHGDPAQGGLGLHQQAQLIAQGVDRLHDPDVCAHQIEASVLDGLQLAAQPFLRRWIGQALGIVGLVEHAAQVDRLTVEHEVIAVHGEVAQAHRVRGQATVPGVGEQQLQLVQHGVARMPRLQCGERGQGQGHRGASWLGSDGEGAEATLAGGSHHGRLARRATALIPVAEFGAAHAQSCGESDLSGRLAAVDQRQAQAGRAIGSPVDGGGEHFDEVSAAQGDGTGEAAVVEVPRLLRVGQGPQHQAVDLLVAGVDHTDDERCLRRVETSAHIEGEGAVRAVVTAQVVAAQPDVGPVVGRAELQQQALWSRRRGRGGDEPPIPDHAVVASALRQLLQHAGDGHGERRRPGLLPAQCEAPRPAVVVGVEQQLPVAVERDGGRLIFALAKRGVRADTQLVSGPGPGFIVLG